MSRAIDGVILSLTIVLSIVLSIGCLNAQAQTGQVVFKDPDPSRPDATLLCLTHDPAVPHYANSHNTQS